MHSRLMENKRSLADSAEEAKQPRVLLHSGDARKTMLGEMVPPFWSIHSFRRSVARLDMEFELIVIGVMRERRGRATISEIFLFKRRFCSQLVVHSSNNNAIES